jgi:hypothetical protein
MISEMKAQRRTRHNGGSHDGTVFDERNKRAEEEEKT